ncbi:MAG: HAMP domain-containing sensor histidine kinase [Christensenella sp.]
MGTRLIKSRYNLVFKIVAWIICMVMACLISFSAVRLAKYDPAKTITSDKFVESADYLQSMNDYTASVTDAFYGYDDAEKQIELRNYISTLRDSYANEIGEVLNGANVGENDYEKYVEKFKTEFSVLVAQSGQTEAETSAGEVASANKGEPDSVAAEELPPLDEYAQTQINVINEKYAGLLTNAQSYVDEKYASMKSQAQENLRRNENYYYAVEENGDIVYTNVLKSEKDPLLWIQTLNANKAYPWNGAEPALYSALPTTSGEQAAYDANTPKTITGPLVYVGMSNAFYEDSGLLYGKNYRGYLSVITSLIVWIAAFAAAFIWLMYTAGRSSGTDDVKVSFMDAIYLDIGGVALFVIALWLAVMFTNERFWMPGMVSALQVIKISVYTGIGVALLLMWSMSISRRVKRQENHTLVGRIFRGFQSTYSRGSIRSKGVGAVVWFMIGGMLMCFMTIGLGMIIGGTGTFIGLVFTAIYLTAVLKYILGKAAALQEIADGVEHIKSGDLEYKMIKCGGAEFETIATGIEHIAEGLDAAVTREVKSERMKTELITNVSHDIKTPLTSILTYVDLLKHEGLTSANAPKYLEVLDMKSRRLKYLTDDLFEAAKASSGDMTVEMSKIELVQFMEQALGEMSDKIDASGLECISAAVQEKIYVYADGKLLWRVIGNVIDNAIKYAAEHSRVYIDFLRTDGNVCIVVKNMSRDPLNMSEEELMERFKRGDESRNTEGSGLGLSIARNFMQLMNGEFKVEIDGDLFKALICFSVETE